MPFRVTFATKHFSGNFANWPHASQHAVFLAPGLVVIFSTLCTYLERIPWFAAGTEGGVPRGPERNAMMRRWTKEGIWACCGFVTSILILLVIGQYRRVAGLP